MAFLLLSEEQHEVSISDADAACNLHSQLSDERHNHATLYLLVLVFNFLKFKLRQ